MGSYEVLLKLANCGKQVGNYFHGFLKSEGVTFKKWEVLNLLLLNETIVQDEICCALDIHKATLKTMLDELEESGLVERSVRTENKKFNDVVLTSRGRKKCLRLLALLKTRSKEFGGNIKTIEPMLDRVIEDIERVKK